MCFTMIFEGTNDTFEWDDLKDKGNLDKHGISFSTAKRVFADINVLLLQDRVDEKTGEQRWHAIGRSDAQSGSAPILLVVHVYRSKNGKNIVRIISARRASKKEVREYNS